MFDDTSSRAKALRICSCIGLTGLVLELSWIRGLEFPHPLGPGFGFGLILAGLVTCVVVEEYFSKRSNYTPLAELVLFLPFQFVLYVAVCVVYTLPLSQPSRSCWFAAYGFQDGVICALVCFYCFNRSNGPPPPPRPRPRWRAKLPGLFEALIDKLGLGTQHSPGA